MKVRISLFFLVLSSYCLLCLYFFIKSLIENYEEGVGFGLFLFIGAGIVLLLEQAVIKIKSYIEEGLDY